MRTAAVAWPVLPCTDLKSPSDCKRRFGHIQFPDIRHDKVLHHRHRLGVGLGRPFVLGGLDWDPFVQHLLHRHGVGHEERAVQQFLFDRDLSLLRLLPGLEALPSLARLAGMVFVLVTDGVGISALHDRCHRDGDKTVYSFCLILHIHKIPR